MNEYQSRGTSPPAIPQSTAAGFGGQATATSGMATGALVCGLLSFCTGITGIVALVLGLISLSEIKKSNGRLGGKGLAIGGMVAGLVGMLMFAALPILLLIPALERARITANQTMDMSQLRQTTTAFYSYAVDNDDRVTSNVELLVVDGYMPASILISPFREDGSAADIDPTAVVGEDELNDAPVLYRVGDYWFVRGYRTIGRISSPSLAPVAFSAIVDERQEGRAVAFADGHVSFYSFDAFDQMIEDANAARSTDGQRPIDLSLLDDR